MNSFNKIIVHGGVFHADDVFCVALANKFLGHPKVSRVFEIPEDDLNDRKTLICDIGRKYDGVRFFDHHQDNAPVKDNGTKYSACGQLLEYINPGISNILYRNLLRVVMAIDANDNYGKFDSLSTLISSYNPNWNSSETTDECFFKAVKIAEIYIDNCISKAKSIYEAETIVNEAMMVNKFSNVLVLDRYLPFMEFVVDTRFDFVVFPSQRGGWNAQCVPISRSKMNVPKKPFPRSAKNLKGVTFVHTEGFLLSAETKENAIDACKSL